MATVFDVAEFILEQLGFVSTMKLQKLVFYSQAYSLVHNGCSLFDEDFEAWVNGPVCRSLFNAHRGKFIIGAGELGIVSSSHPVQLEDHAARAVMHVLSILGSLSGRELSELTHREAPWIDARFGLSEGEYCESTITKAAMREYYSSPQCDNPVFA